MPIPRLMGPVFRLLAGCGQKTPGHALPIGAGSISGDGEAIVPEAFEFPDISSRYDAPGSIAGHRRGVRVRAD
jgi:hypothetical protein